MGENIIKSLVHHSKTWWKSTTVIVLFTLLAMTYQINIPLFFLPVIYWLISLRVLNALSCEEKSVQKLKQNPLKRAVQTENLSKSTKQFTWNKFNIVTIDLKRLPHSLTTHKDTQTALERAVADTLFKFKASTGYIHLQKICLIYSPRQKLPVKLATIKLQVYVVTTIVSFLSARYLFHMRSFHKAEGHKNLFIKPPFSFMGDVLEFDSGIELMKQMLNVCGEERESSMIKRWARRVLKEEELSGLSTEQILEKLKALPGFDIESIPGNLKYGIFCKHENDILSMRCKQITFTNEDKDFLLKFCDVLPIDEKIQEKDEDTAPYNKHFKYTPTDLESETDKK